MLGAWAERAFLTAHSSGIQLQGYPDRLSANQGWCPQLPDLVGVHIVYLWDRSKVSRVSPVQLEVRRTQGTFLN